MNFEFSEEQLFIRDQARNFLQQESTPEVVRSVLDTDAPYHRELWQKIVAAGEPAGLMPAGLGARDTLFGVADRDRRLAVAALPAQEEPGEDRNVVEGPDLREYNAQRRGIGRAQETVDAA